MNTVAHTHPHSKHHHMVARLTARLLRRRFHPGDVSPCCDGESLIPDPVYPAKVLCPEGGELYRAA